MALSIHPFGLKERSRSHMLSSEPFDRFSLAMYPSDQFFLEASILRALRQGRAYSDQRCVENVFFEPSPCSAMDFSNAGAVERAGNAFRAHVQWREKGAQRDIRGPRRLDQEAAQKDLERMRAAADGKSREEGFSAMVAEGLRLRDEKPTKQAGSVAQFGNSYASCVQWRERGVKRHTYGPRRAEKQPHQN